MLSVAPVGRFAELLRRHRAGSGLGQRELARRSGLSERAIRDLERGVRAPRTHSARLVAGALELAGDDLSAFLAAAVPGASVSSTTPGRPIGSPDRLIGRDAELRALLDLVAGARHRLVTVTGPGGIGKSRLVAELAVALGGRTDLAVCALDLSAVREPELVGELVADALGCGPSRLAPVDRVAAQLGERRVVLLLDRFEQLVAAASEVAALVRRCSGLTVVVTSQRALRVRGERLFALDPLPADAAVALFASRAAAARPDFVLDAGTRPAVARICRRVGHLPLAVELAAARVRLLHPAELAERLDRQLAVLADGARDLPARHRSLRATIEASLDVVSADARTLFRWLGAFAGGARLGDVEAVAEALGRDPTWVLTTLTELVDITLVRVAAQAATSRYLLADPMAELAGEQLRGSPDQERVSRALAVRMLRGPAVDDRDAANVRAAVSWATTHEPDLVDDATAAALGRFWESTGRLREGQDLLSRLAVHGPKMAWVRAGHLASLRGDLTGAVSLAEQALVSPDHLVRAAALNLLAQTTVESGDPVAGRTLLRAALVAARRAGDVTMIGRVFNNLSAVSVELGRPRDAERQQRAALAAKRRSGAGAMELGRSLYNLAEITLEFGEPATAGAHAAEAVPLLRSAGYLRLAALAETTAALASLRRGDTQAALAAVDRAETLLAGEGGDDRRMTAIVGLRVSVVRHATGDRSGAARALRTALPSTLEHNTRDRDEAADAFHAHARHLVDRDPAGAAALIGAGDALRRRPPPARIRTQRDEAAAAARAALGEATFAAGCRHGARLDPAGLLDLCARVG
ncbi:helix-turn-helix domain-containing protein [Asanoa sp. WMMD1127]|uniref:ATP-binding protein n=1 Tax=Asanoa sp. WMMD1127 TaxID=3016107 RepID=UPI002415C150|nr:AAA family ATPase [Asanoa sp. WMMD1127]MDG4826921.1 helix-turn-helix domain-containing protein [Asanoa sp. WMMD1127]